MKEKEIEIENGDETVNASKAAESAESKGQDGESRAEGEETANGEAEQAGNGSQEEAKADPLEEANAKIAELTDKYLRSVAEFDNYRKRTLKEKAELILNGGEKAISAILPVLDDMERAIANGKKSDDAAVIREGMELIFSKFLKALESLGVKKIDTDGADFDTDEAYLIVKLDEVCRHQQYGEGWFPTMDAVPTDAISMSVPQIMKSKVIICVVPDTRKAEAVKNMMEGEITNMCPASILRRHPACTTYLDESAASLLKK